MVGVFKSILLCGVCTLVTGVTFDWKEFHSKGGAQETIVDHSTMGLQSFDENGIIIHYLCGPLTIHQPLDDSYKVHYILQYKNEKSQKFGAVSGIPDRTVGACEFVVDFVRKYLLPVTRHHNDFPPRTSTWCPLEARTYHVYQVENFTQLIAPSDLKPAEYKLCVMFRKDGLDIGGYEGRFVAFDS